MRGGEEKVTRASKPRGVQHTIIELKRLYSNHPDRFELLKQKSFLAWASVVIAYGIGDYSRTSDENVIKRLEEEYDLQITNRQIDEHRKIGMCILGWPIEYASTKVKVEAIEHKWQQKQKGERIMASMSEIRDWLQENYNGEKDKKIREQEAMFVKHQTTLPEQERSNIQFVNVLDKFIRGYDISRIASELELSEKETEKQLYVACSLVGFQPSEGSFNKFVRRTVAEIKQMSHQEKDEPEEAKPDEVFGPVQLLDDLEQTEKKVIRVFKIQEELWKFTWEELSTRPGAEVQDDKAILRNTYAPVLKSFMEQSYPDVGLDVQWCRHHWEALVNKGAIEVVKGNSDNSKDNTYYVLNPAQEGLTVIVLPNNVITQERLSRKIQDIVLPPFCDGLWSSVFKQAKAVKGVKVRQGVIQWHGSYSAAVKGYITKAYPELIPALDHLDRVWVSKTWEILIGAGVVQKVPGKNWNYYFISAPYGFRVSHATEEVKIIAKLSELLDVGVGEPKDLLSPVSATAGAKIEDEPTETEEQVAPVADVELVSSVASRLNAIGEEMDQQIATLDAEVLRMDNEISAITEARKGVMAERQRCQRVKDAIIPEEVTPESE